MANLPSGYTELEWIESTGTQYINTELSAPSGFKAELNCTITSAPNSLNMLLGAHDQAPPYNRNFLAVTSAGQWEIGAYNPLDFGSFSVNTPYQIEVCTISGEICLILNGVTQDVDPNLAPSTVRSDLPLYLFALNYADGLFPARMRLSGCNLYLSDESTAERKYIPCISPSQEIGLYDLVYGVFYGNSGTGVFIAGPEVSPPETPDNFFQSTSVVLQWSTVECDGYKLYKNGSLLITTKSNQYVDSAVANGQDIEYSITAYRGNLESEPQTIQVSVREGYTILTPIITSAFFQ